MGDPSRYLVAGGGSSLGSYIGLSVYSYKDWIAAPTLLGSLIFLLPEELNHFDDNLTLGVF
jgi:hypothetical protein